MPAKTRRHRSCARRRGAGCRRLSTHASLLRALSRDGMDRGRCRAMEVWIIETRSIYLGAFRSLSGDGIYLRCDTEFQHDMTNQRLG